jgi:hypothetical protein
MAYGGPLLCAWIRFIHRHAKKEDRQGTEWPIGSNREGADLGDCRQATRAVRGRRGTSPHVGCGKCPPALPPFFTLSLLRFVLSPCIFWLSRAPFSHPHPLFLLPFTPQWHSPILRAGSNRLLFVSRWQPSIPIVLYSLTLPLTKPPLTTPTHRLAGLRNG